MHRRLVAPARAAAFAAVALFISASFVAAQTTQPADVPAPKIDAKTGQPNEKFMALHQQFLERAARGDVDLLFLGDSITAGWNGQKGIWQAHFDKYKPANFGIGGDRTQHVLWRIENGELAPPMKPKVVVLMIGTNNTNSDPSDQIASGVEKIVKSARDKTGAKVLLLAVFPRGENPNDEKVVKQRAIIKGVNDRIKKLDDGKNVRYLDIGDKFLQPDGSISKEIMRDFLHLTEKGYQIWAEAIDQPLKEMME
ncbi:MAG: hypothetical protein QOF78_1706 [Phycisphaerales bacterium]|jgi:lysophospholipase L1-like esterase|nr:hypothetical protein [Phycisphaerales bacterium]